MSEAAYCKYVPGKQKKRGTLLPKVPPELTVIVRIPLLLIRGQAISTSPEERRAISSRPFSSLIS